ncbi:MAG: site-specific integrase [Arcobacteraceae bacterium]|nr:site-specific integrase [Arcobacteraceae bacterium]
MSRIKTNFTGVYYSILQNKDKVYYITYKNTITNRKVWVKIGKFSEGIREAYCNQKRNEIITKQRLGEEPPAAIKKKKAKKNLLEDIANEYFNTRKNNATTKADKGIYNNYIAPYFDDIDTIDKNMLTKWKKTLQSLQSKRDKEKKLSTKYINDIQNLLITIDRFALRNDLTKNDFSKYIIKDIIDNARERFLTKVEIQELYKYVENDISLLLFYKIALNTGGRLATVLNITKKDIDFTHKLITLKDFKNNSTYKSFLNNDLIELLKDYTRHLTANDKLFILNHQRRLRATLNELFNNEIDKDDTKNKVVIHTLRHTFASHLAINGTPIYTIQKLMNHKDIKMTLRYAKLNPDSGRESVINLGF